MTVIANTRTFLLVEKKFRGVYGQRAFSRCGPKLWNNLAQPIRIESDTDAFKKKLKSFLMNEHLRFYSRLNCRWIAVVFEEMLLLCSSLLVSEWVIFCRSYLQTGLLPLFVYLFHFTQFSRIKVSCVWYFNVYAIVLWLEIFIFYTLVQTSSL